MDIKKGTNVRDDIWDISYSFQFSHFSFRHKVEQVIFVLLASLLAKFLLGTLGRGFVYRCRVLVFDFDGRVGILIFQFIWKLLYPFEMCLAASSDDDRITVLFPLKCFLSERFRSVHTIVDPLKALGIKMSAIVWVHNEDPLSHWSHGLN